MQDDNQGYSNYFTKNTGSAHVFLVVEMFKTKGFEPFIGPNIYKMHNRV